MNEMMYERLIWELLCANPDLRITVFGNEIILKNINDINEEDLFISQNEDCDPYVYDIVRLKTKDIILFSYLKTDIKSLKEAVKLLIKIIIK
jgi:hypothetical protein